MQHIIAHIIIIPTLYRVEYLKRIKSSIAYTMIEHMIVPAVTLEKVRPGNVKKSLQEMCTLPTVPQTQLVESGGRKHIVIQPC